MLKMELINEQNRAYYESLNKDIEKEISENLKEIERMELKQLQEIQKNELLKLEEINKREKEKNQPSKEELRQIRLKFFENKKNE